MTETFINHCISMYNSLDERAIAKKLDSGESAKVFAGSYYACWRSTKISQTYYSPVRKALERHGSILILQRGGRQVDTVIVLQGLPDEWDVNGWRDKSDLTATTNYAKLASALREVEKSIGGMNVVKALDSIAKRLDKIESQITTKTTKTTTTTTKTKEK